MPFDLRDPAGSSKSARNVLVTALEQMLASDAADDDMVRRTFSVEVRAGSIDEATRSAEFVFSTDAIDSYDEVVEQDWVLKRYRKNPVVLYGHNRSSGFFSSLSQSETVPIGKSKSVRVEDGQLVGRIYFATEKANPFAEQIWNSVLEETLRAVSVGFRPGEIDQEKRNGKDVYVLRKNELFEVSVVPIPANYQAVIRDADGAPQTVRERNHGQLRRLMEQRAGATTSATPSASVANNTDPTVAPSGPEHPKEPGMDPKELEALKAELESVKAERDALSAKCAAHDAQLSESTAAQQASAEQVDELSEKLTKLTAEHEELVKECDELKTARDAAELEVAKNDVEALIGKKATPAERDDLLEDRQRLGAEKFAERMSKRADLPYCESVAGSDPKPKNDVVSGESAAAQVANKAAKKAADEASRS